MGLHDMAMFYAEYMHGLKKLMRIPPKRAVHVQVIDDDEIAVAGLRTLLGHWNNVALLAVIQSGGRMPYLDLESDIVLIDDEMDNLSGAEVIDRLRDKSYYRLIASIGQHSFEKLRVRHHFDRKARVGRELTDTKDFIEFMNSMISEIVRIRME